ncbi:hypothetical protein BGZ94_001556, partial [Podila epigama]
MEHQPKGPGGMTDSQKFFTRFRLECAPAIAPDVFATSGPTYVRLLLTDETDITKYENAVASNTIRPYTIKVLEDIFMSACQTQEEIGKALDEIAHVGRLDDETWERYGQRIKRLASCYKINNKDHYLLNRVLHRLDDAAHGH